MTFDEWYAAAIKRALASDNLEFLMDHQTACKATWAAAKKEREA